MPRPPKNQIDFDSEIRKSMVKIEKYTNLLEEERIRLESLKNKKRDAELQELYLFMQERGVSVRDVIDTLHKNLKGNVFSSFICDCQRLEAAQTSSKL